MAETKLTTVSSLKKGSNVVIENVACTVTNTQTSRPGKHGHAKTRLEAVGMLDGRKRQVVMPGHDTVSVPIIEKKSAQVLSIANNVANLMDSETYETFDLPIPDELQGQVVDGISIIYWEILNDKVMKQIKSE
ncbi:MAG: translation initiation factor IF-5A [Nanoarchaeota archaeon]|nr:translation initiation factor IF-5A [Nanoarchaeota archaeon]